MMPVNHVDISPTSRAEYRPEQDSVIQLFLLFRQSWRSLRNATVIGFVIGLAVAFAIPNYYTAYVRLMPPDSGGASGMLNALIAAKGLPSSVSDIAGSVTGLKNTSAVFMRVFRSRTVEDAVIRRHDLRSVYWRKYYETTRKKLESRTEITEDKKSGVIEIAVTDSDRQRAKAMAETYVDEANKLLANVSTSAARRERMFIENRLAQANQDLHEAERQLSEFSSKNTTLDVKEQTKAMVSAGAELQANIIAAKSELEGLQQTYNKNNVRVRTLKARIIELEGELSKLSGSAAADSGSTELYPPLKKLPKLGAQWADLYRNSQVQEKLFELLTQQYEMAKIQEAREIPVLKELDAPEVPERKSWPPRALIVSCFGVLAFFGTLGKFLLRDFISNHPQHPFVLRLQTYIAFSKKAEVSAVGKSMSLGR